MKRAYWLTMEISSPTTVDEQVTDLDIGFGVGVIKSWTLSPHETFRDGGDCLIVTTVNPDKVITLYKAFIAWTEVGYRTVKRPVKAPKPA